jgi:hypothetical protein
MRNKKESCKPVSRILYAALQQHGHHLSVTTLTHGNQSAYPPTVAAKRPQRRAAFYRFTWHFSMQGLPKVTVTCNLRELLPHVFTLISAYRDGYFLWHFLLALLPPGCSPVHCSMLSRLSSARFYTNSDDPVCSCCKCTLHCC